METITLNPYIVYAGFLFLSIMAIVLFNQQQIIMDENQALLDYAGRIDAATNNIATQLTELRAEVSNHASPETLQRLDQTIGALEALGKNPTEGEGGAQ